jgi:hypothetical protein
MPDYILLMHNDTTAAADDAAWAPYLARLRASGVFQGGSAIGDGNCVKKSAVAAAITATLSGYIRVSAANLAQAGGLVIGNPVFEAGGTVEIRELPRSD